ncbi:MAG: translation initiation factor IF-2 [Candidatus Hadarchaeales archaeon]
MKNLRCPIVAILGHVDHGKTTLLDTIRGTAVASREPGRITQWIGASEVPLEAIKKISGELMKRMGIELAVPGLLFVDTPGHEAFTNLRKRGGSLADLAVLVVDVKEGFMPQTVESLQILRTYKTPFMVAANKIDLLPGWMSSKEYSFLQSLRKQTPETQALLDRKVYELVGELHKQGFDSERFDRVSDFRKQVSIVPLSAKTGEGLAELLVVLAGLAQRFLREALTIEVTGPGKGTVLEVKEEMGLGTVMDVILYDGKLSVGDLLAVVGKEGVRISKVKAILKPKPLDEIRDPEERFERVKSVTAASGVRVSATQLEGVVAGTPFKVLKEPSEVQDFWKEVEEEMKRIRITSDINGVVLKADTLGSLEALEGQLRGKGIPIRKADVGEVSKRDVVEASTVAQSDPLLGVVLAFNVSILPDAEEEASKSGITVLSGNIIYELLEAFDKWREAKQREVREKKLEGLIRPAKFSLKPGYVFRRSDPAIVGISVLGGVLRPKYPVMRKDGKPVGRIKEMQKEKKSVEEARKGDELAVSIDEAVVGRNIKEGDILFTDIPKDHALKLQRELRDLLSGDEQEVLDEIISIKRREDPNYGIM